MKSEKKPGFWDSLVIKQNVQSRKPDEIEGWEPPQITAADSASDAATALNDYSAWSGWEDETSSEIWRRQLLYKEGMRSCHGLLQNNHG